MPPTMKNALTKLGGGVNSFSVAQKTIALILLAVLAMGGIALATWLSKPAYTPLFSGLQPADANSIVEQLRTDGVPYELSAGGGTILVPEENVYDQRLKAASAGLPAETGTGYSLLDDMAVTSSEFQQSVTYKRAIEGELAATIGALEGIKTASVQLAIPEQTVFVAEKADPTASVFVESRPGQTLTAESVQAIVHLTSASVEGMTPENVAVIDSNGKVLSAIGTGAVGTVDQQSSDYEQRVTASVQTMLDRVVGPGAATVAVAADMSEESAKRIEETFVADEDTPALNESTTTETYTGSGGRGAGVLGPDNIAVPEGEGGEGTYEQESTTKNNAVNKVTEERDIPAGTLTKQTVSVAVDEGAAAGLDVAALTTLVSNAAGIDEDRGDVVAVEILPFSTAGAEAAAAALAEAEAAREAAEQEALFRNAIIAAAIVVIVLICAVVFAVRNRRQKRELVDLGEQLPEPVIIERAPEPVALVAPETTAIATIPEPENDAVMRRAAVSELATRDPDKTAEYLRGLMADERTKV